MFCFLKIPIKLGPSVVFVTFCTSICAEFTSSWATETFLVLEVPEEVTEFLIAIPIFGPEHLVKVSLKSDENRATSNDNIHFWSKQQCSTTTHFACIQSPKTHFRKFKKFQQINTSPKFQHRDGDSSLRC